MKQIAEILQSADACVAIEAFERNLADIEDEITALSTDRSVTRDFIKHLYRRSERFALPDDASLLELADSLTVSRIKQSVKTSGLLKIKPDARSFGFDCPQVCAENGASSRAYELWVSIPDDMEVAAPFVRRSFHGGLYAAHVLQAWDFGDWRLLRDWVNASGQYESDWGAPRWTSPEKGAGQELEETLNFYYFAQSGQVKGLQLDLLFPIKEKKVKEYNVGTSIPFGGYHWRILAIKDNAALLITEYIVEQRAYHSAYKAVTWADCALRKYLNGAFFDRFTAEEQARILPVWNKNPDNPWYGTKGGADTLDRIFLLSMEQAVCQYFGDSSAKLYHPGKNQRYWFERKDANNGKRVARLENETWNSWWWLRSPGRVPVKAVYVHGDGNIGIQGNNILKGNVSDGACKGGVRPALWLAMDAAHE